MRRNDGKWRRLTRGVLPTIALVMLLAGGADPGERTLRTVGAKQCAECHESEVEVWKRTAHYVNARTFTRSPEAQSIAKAIGVRRVKSDERCTSCHFTVTQAEGRKARAADGVSCESCPGAARDWIDVHGDYGAMNTTRATESAAHRKQRIAASDRNGMNRVHELYDLTSNCYGCHVVADEQLVNDGGHSPGGFLDFVAYTQGDMRHNFVRGAKKQNEISEPNRQHQMYVVSRVLEAEYALRALALATKDGAYASHQANLVRVAVKELQAIAKRAPSREIRAVLKATMGVRIAPNQSRAALAAAEQVRTNGRALANPERASELAGAAPLLSRPASRARP